MKQIAKQIALPFFMALAVCACRPNAPKSEITPEMAYEGVSNYCHGTYDWSIAADNPGMMSVSMGEETDSAYQVVFRSYTGAYVYFYVNKASGNIRIVEYEPVLDARSETGSINLFDYINNEKPNK